MRPDFTAEVIRGNDELLAGCHALERNSLLCEFLLADHDDELSLLAVRFPHLCFQASSQEIHLAGYACPAKLHRPLDRPASARFVGSRDKHLRVDNSGTVDALSFHHHEKALDARSEADCRGLLAAKLFGEKIVPASAGERILGAQIGTDDFKSSFRIVIKPAEDPAVD